MICAWPLSTHHRASQHDLNLLHYELAKLHTLIMISTYYTLIMISLNAYRSHSMLTIPHAYHATCLPYHMLSEEPTLVYVRVTDVTCRNLILTH